MSAFSRRPATGLVSIFALALAACGGSGSGIDDQPDPTPDPAPPPTGTTGTFNLSVSDAPIKDATKVCVRFDGVDTRDAAAALNGVELSVPRARLPQPEPDEFYHADLIGLTVTLTDGTPVGTVVAVHDFGAGDLVEIAPATGASFLLPFTRATVPEIDLAGGSLVIDPPDGLLPTQEDEAP